MQLTLKNRVNVPQLITDGKSLKYVAVAKTSKFTYQILNIDVSLYLEYVYIPTSNAKSWFLGKKVKKHYKIRNKSRIMGMTIGKKVL